MKRESGYLKIKKHYEECLEKYGDNHLGVDWPNLKDAALRYKIMIEVIRNTSKKVSILDFGCGLSHLYSYIVDNDIKNIEYTGLDISQKFISASRKKYPRNRYICADILTSKKSIGIYDYIVMNGVFTEKTDLTFEEMLLFFKKIIKKTYTTCREGVAFNVMSKQVDWERRDLFHLSLDALSDFLCKSVSRNFIIRNDYGLYEYTVYIYKESYR